MSERITSLLQLQATIRHMHGADALRLLMEQDGPWVDSKYQPNPNLDPTKRPTFMGACLKAFILHPGTYDPGWMGLLERAIGDVGVSFLEHTLMDDVDATVNCELCGKPAGYHREFFPGPQTVR